MGIKRAPGAPTVGATPRFLSKKERDRTRDELARQERREKEKQRKEQEKQLAEIQEERNLREQEDRARRKLEAERRNKSKEDVEREEQLKEIKMHRLGVPKVKKKVVKPQERTKYRFEWDKEDDTTALPGGSLLLRGSEKTSLLFGRGYRGGLDRKEQRHRNESYIDHVEKHRYESDHHDRARDDNSEHRAKRSRRSFDIVNDLGGKHWKEKSREEMTERDWRIFREDFEISTSGGRLTAPLRSWSEAALSTEILAAVERAGYKEPSPIQMATIPVALANRDIIGIAQTGSGKTCAFVLPMLSYISKMPRMTRDNAGDGPYALILAPTRELAQQIEEEARKFAESLGYRVVSIVGGHSIEEQGISLRDGAEIVVATPGRLNDALERRYIVLSQCHYIVLDEADRMLNMGFEAQVNAILDAMPSKSAKSSNPEIAEAQERENRIYRTTMMFSATMPPDVERLARKYLRHPAVITIGSAGQAASDVKQVIHFAKNENEKKQILLRLTRSAKPPIIIFANTRKSSEAVARFLDSSKVPNILLHAGKSQDQREAALDGFRKRIHPILVATDVACRGIDIKGVENVINFEMPQKIEFYTHRIGRTGRAGESGVATSIITNEDSDLFFDLKKMVQQNKSSEVPPEFLHHPAANQDPKLGKKPRAKVQYAKR